MNHPSRVTVVIATRDRRDELDRTLRELPGVPVIVVDNGSTDDSPEAGRAGGAQVIELGRNHGAPARNVGVEAARTPYVAFSDDDSWWAPGALDRAADALDAHPRLGLVAARTLVGPQQRPDPVTPLLADSPLPRPAGAAGPAVLGFLACSAVVRREAFLDAGGFSDVLFFLGEERLLSWDLAARGWELAFLDDVVAHHHPSTRRGDPDWRRRTERRNALLTAWLRRPLPVAAREAAELARDAVRDPVARGALAGALARLPAVVRHRAPLPAAVERQVRLLEEAPR